MDFDATNPLDEVLNKKGDTNNDGNSRKDSDDGTVPSSTIGSDSTSRERSLPLDHAGAGHGGIETRARSFDDVFGSGDGAFGIPDTGTTESGEAEQFNRAHGEGLPSDIAEHGSEGTRGSEEHAELVLGDSLRKLFQPKDYPGWHSILTDGVIDEFCNCLKFCLFIELAAAECNIAPNSLKEWLRQGRRMHEYLWHYCEIYNNGTEYGTEKLKEIFAAVTPNDWQVYKFYCEVKKAKAQNEVDNLRYIQAARGKDWKASKYLLSIMNRERYSENENANNITVNAGNDFSVKVVDYGELITGADDSIEVEADEIEGD